MDTGRHGTGWLSQPTSHFQGPEKSESGRSPLPCLVPGPGVQSNHAGPCQQLSGGGQPLHPCLEQCTGSTCLAQTGPWHHRLSGSSFRNEAGAGGHVCSRRAGTAERRPSEANCHGSQATARRQTGSSHTQTRGSRGGFLGTRVVKQNNEGCVL